jgi:AraC-like DNA-binding protein
MPSPRLGAPQALAEHAKPNLTMAHAETISAAMVLRLVKLLESRATDAGALLAELGLTREALEASSARVTYAASDRLLESAAAALGANGLGLALALTRSDESYGAAGLLLVTGATFRQGLSRSLRYQRLWGDGDRFSLVPTPAGYAVRFHHPGASRLAAAIAAECAFAEVLAGVRALVDPAAVPLAVELSHAALGDSRTFAEYLGIAPRFEQSDNRIVFTAALFDRPMHAVRDLLGAALERQAAQALSMLPARHSIVARVRPLLAGEAGLRRSLTDVAAALRVSPRTLQRRLTQGGTSFQELVDETRRTLALELERAGTPVKEIAYRLGFQDPSALARARRRWRR